MSENTTVTLWVVYDHPEDYPDHWVVREQFVRPGGSIGYGLPHLCSSLEEARSVVPTGLYNLGRKPEDVPTIKEVWI